MKRGREPKWLDKWLTLPFYEKECERHRLKYHTVYCGSCNDGRPACEVCWDAVSDQHDEKTHQILKVRSASSRASAAVTEISRFLDVLKIQIYNINNKEIVFLNPNEKSVPIPPHVHAVVPICRACRRRLKREDVGRQYEFCSIACKSYFQREEEEADDLEMEKESEDEEKSELSINQMNFEKLYSRRINDECYKRIRKGRKPQHKEDGDLKKSEDAEKCNKIKATATTETTTTNDECRPPSASASRREKPRKGIPKRAPFF